MPTPPGEGQILQMQGLKWGDAQDAIHFDNGGLVVDTQQGLFSKGPDPWVDARALGARGQNNLGVDDGPIIQAAINTAANASPVGRAGVRIGQGVFTLKTPLIQNNSYSTIEGAGQFQTILRVPSGTTFTAAIYVGQNTCVDGVMLKNLSIQVDSGATCNGIVINGGDCVVENVYIQGASLDGLKWIATQNCTQNKTENVYINLGLGTSGMYVGTAMFDCDFSTVIVKGGVAGSVNMTQGIGIYNQGTSTHLYGCHPYFCASAGLYSDTGSVQVNGGEYETCGIGVNLASQTLDYGVHNINGGFYANTLADINIQNVTSGVHGAITGNSFSSISTRNVLVNSPKVNISHNTFRNYTFEPMLLDVTGNNCVVGNNIFDATTATTNGRGLGVSGSGNIITGNQFIGPLKMQEVGSADYNVFVANHGSAGLIGAHSVATMNY